MLLEEQVAELLRRCERLVGKTLPQIRSDLRSAQTRAAAVWELLVIEASSHMGTLQHEPVEHGSLDIAVTRPCGRRIWIEATYLKPRFLDEQRKSDAVRTWILQEAHRLGIELGKISVRFEGQSTWAGTARDLPELSEGPQFLRTEEIKQFFTAIKSQPNNFHACAHSRYTVKVTYTPTTYYSGIMHSELAMEYPKSVKENSIFRKLKTKVRQVSLAEPVIVCVGGDSSPVLSRLHPTAPSSIAEAVSAAFRQSSSLSAVVLVSIANQRDAITRMFVNNIAKHPLSTEEVALVNEMEFNRWKYTYPFINWDRPTTPQPMGGKFTTRVSTKRGSMEIEVEIPSSILVEFLAGRTYLAKEYKWDEPLVNRALREGWSIAACSLKDGNIESAEPPKIVLKLIQPTHVF